MLPSLMKSMTAVSSHTSRMGAAIASPDGVFMADSAPPAAVATCSRRTTSSTVTSSASGFTAVLRAWAKEALCSALVVTPTAHPSSGAEMDSCRQRTTLNHASATVALMDLPITSRWCRPVDAVVRPTLGPFCQLAESAWIQTVIDGEACWATHLVKDLPKDTPWP